MRHHDALVVGGGLVGSAIAYGLARSGLGVALLDEGDDAFRASRGNFGLVWVQGKGDGLAAYAAWTRRSADLWPGFAEELSDGLGQDIGYRKPGGLHLCFSERELGHYAAVLQRMDGQGEPGNNDCRLLDRNEVAELLPGVGPEVVGAVFSPHDGHVNPLLLLRALHRGLQRLGAVYLPGRPVEGIERSGAHFPISCGGKTLLAERVVVAAGLGSRRLAPQAGLSMPVSPLKGQILVTERVRPFLNHPVSFLRQTEEGGLLLGDSHEDQGFDLASSTGVMREIAARAVRAFPGLAEVNLVRSWAALRIMTPDGFPIYDRSESRPGAFAVTCHSGVTLAAAHALELAPAIAAGRLESFAAFSAGRFHVPPP